jgi:hypothetical protein
MTTPQRSGPGLTGRKRIAAMRARSRRQRRIEDRLLAIALILGAWVTSSWTLMITTGIAHDDWWHLMPPMGAGAAFALTAAPLAVTIAVTLVHEILTGG